MYQCVNNNIRVILPLISLIEGTLVVRNSEEPITLYPGIFKGYVLNLSKSWIIASLIEDPHNFLSEVDLTSVTFSQTVQNKQNKPKVGSTKKSMVNIIHMNLTDYHAINTYIMAGFMAHHK